MPFVRINDRNVLFIHIPRTGGTTIEHWMRELGDLKLFSYSLPTFSKVTPQHLRFADVKELLGEGYFEYAFTVVRNPFDRIASEYCLRASLAAKGIWGGVPRFDTWLEYQVDLAQKNPTVLDNHMRPQWEFVSESIKVFKYEDGLLSVLDAVAQDIGVQRPNTLSHKLSMANVRENVTFDIPEIERIRAFYRIDFERFGYSTSPPRTNAPDSDLGE